MLFIERGDCEFNPFLTLYADGPLIYGPGRYQKQLSQKETTEVVTKLEKLGFFQIQDTYAADVKNPLYILPKEAFPDLNASLPLISITVNSQESKSILYLQQWEKYVIQPMKDIIAYLDSCSNDHTIPYKPDRLLVGVETEKEIPIPEDANVIPWPDTITPPSHISRYDGVLYLEGAEVLKLYNIVEENPEAYFTFEGINFHVSLRPIPPNECHVYHLWENESGDETQSFFTCDDW